jgi:glycosyltransferase involved in cell wall biosynthesis
MLIRCLTSIAKQTATRFEAVIVNDHPPTKEKVAQIVSSLDNRFRLINNDSNLGVAESRNRAIAATSAEIIAPIDDDDVWLPQYLETHLRVHGERPDCAVVYSGYVAESTELGLAPRNVSATAPPPDTFLALLSGRFSLDSTSIFTFRRSAVVEPNAYDRTLDGYEDWDLLCRLAQDGRFVHVPEILTLYRHHAGVRQSTHRMERLDAIRRKWGSFSEVADFLQREIAEAEFNASRSAALSGNRVTAVRHLISFAPRMMSMRKPLRSLMLLLALNVLGARTYRFLQAHRWSTS